MIQEGLFRVHRAFTSGAAGQQKIRKPYALARTIMQRAMWGFYVPGAKPQSNGRVLDTALCIDKLLDEKKRVDPVGNVLLEEAYDNDYHLAHREKVCTPHAGLDGQRDNSLFAWNNAGEQQELFLEQYFTALERACGTQALRIAENLVAPTDPECCLRILEEVNRKRRVQQRQERGRSHGVRPRGAKRHIRLSQRLIREALGLSKSQWMQQLAAVRQFTRQWVDSGRVAAVS